MDTSKKKILLEGIALKIKRDNKTLEEILITYIKLTESEKDEIREEFNK